ncbi:MAG: DinB family protein [Acidimicrobiales bacterium]|jgi:hypothetical protein
MVVATSSSSGNVMAEDRAETLVTNIGESVVSTFDFVWNRLTARLSDLADDEYFWEPAGGCWSLRPGPDGIWCLDGGEGAGPEPDPAPVTTIAWRLGHLAGGKGPERLHRPPLARGRDGLLVPVACSRRARLLAGAVHALA